MTQLSSTRPASFALLGAPIDSVGGTGGMELSPGVLRALADWSAVAPTIAATSNRPFADAIGRKRTLAITPGGASPRC